MIETNQHGIASFIAYDGNEGTSTEELYMAEREIFKKCPMCTFEWKTRDEFLDDNSLELNGYQADFDKLELSLFLFTHMKKNCFSTMAVRVKEFQNLYAGKKYTEQRTGKEDCPGYCLDVSAKLTTSFLLLPAVS